jgi:cell division septation protein DedD
VIELERHIEILLLSNDCVIVPDFGGFVAHHVNARYSKIDGMFLPPMRTIGFNPQLKLNDSLLAQSYIEAYDIGFREAMRRIEDETNQLKEQLEEDRCYRLNDIGTLSINGEGNYDFEPCEGGLLTPSLYGLSSFDIIPLEEKAVINNDQPSALPEKESVEVPKAAVTALFPVSAKSEPAAEEKNNIDNRRFIRIPVSVLRNIAAACIAVIAFFLMPKPLANDNPNINKGGVDTNMLYTIMPKDVTTHQPNLQPVKKANADVSASKTQKIKSAEKPSGEEKTAEVTEKNFFTIVLASKVSRRNARDFVTRLHEKGYSEADVLLKAHNNKVIYGHYSTMKKANLMKNKLNDNAEFADSWTMEINGSK